MGRFRTKGLLRKAAKPSRMKVRPDHAPCAETLIARCRRAAVRETALLVACVLCGVLLHVLLWRLLYSLGTLALSAWLSAWLCCITSVYLKGCGSAETGSTAVERYWK